MLNLSSKRAKACAISQNTKHIVEMRDEGMCIICGRPGLPEAHFIPRSRGGLGIEQNIVTLCRDCHRRFDQGTAEEHEQIKKIIELYLRGIYPDWNEESCIYDKWRDVWT